MLRQSSYTHRAGAEKKTGTRPDPEGSLAQAAALGLMAQRKAAEGWEAEERQRFTKSQGYRMERSVWAGVKSGSLSVSPGQREVASWLHLFILNFIKSLPNGAGGWGVCNLVSQLTADSSMSVLSPAAASTSHLPPALKASVPAPGGPVSFQPMSYPFGICLYI